MGNLQLEAGVRGIGGNQRSWPREGYLLKEESAMMWTTEYWLEKLSYKRHYNLKEITPVLKYSDSVLAKGLNGVLKEGCSLLKWKLS